MNAAMKSLYMGLGSLGGKTDFIQYTDAPVDEDAPVDAENYTAAPILEIRNPPLAGPVSNWYNLAKTIYDAVEESIRYPNGRGYRYWQTRPKEFSNALTPEQSEAQEQAKALENRFLQVEDKEKL